MKGKADNTTLWNEAAKTGAYLGAVSVGCLALKELAAASGNSFWIQAASIVLWAVEFFGCILILKNAMLSLRDRYEDVKIQDTYRMGRRSALLSGLLLASAQALYIMKAPEADITALADSVSQAMPAGVSRDDVDRVIDSLPIAMFLIQWVYCFLYGTVLSSILSRFIFVQKLFGGPFPPKDTDTPDEQ